MKMSMNKSTYTTAIRMEAKGGIMKRASLIAGLLIMVTFSFSWASIPQLMSYQGVLTDGAGTAVPDGNYNITFKIYDTQAGGTVLWTETQNVPVSGGIFNVTLGAVTPLNLPFDRTYWLGISIEGGQELSPRRALTASPYSLNSQGVMGSANVFPSSGNVGIGTTTPAELLDVNGGLKIGGTSHTNAGTIRWTGSDFEGYDGSTWKSFTAGGSGTLPSGSSGQTLRHNGSSWVATSNLFNDGINIGIGLTNPTTTLHVNGGLSLGASSGTFGFMKIYRSGIANPFVYGSTTTNGGILRTYDENYNMETSLEPDANGTGGYFAVKRSAVADGFVVNGNWAGTEEPRVFVQGSARSVVFAMDQSGDASVVLPNDAISSTEISNEPGVASATMGTGSIVLDGTVQKLLSRSITVPASGYVLALATCWAEIHHSNGSWSGANFGVSDVSTSFPSNQDVPIAIGPVAPSATYDIPASPHGLFSVGSAGTYTFYLLGQRFYTDNVYANDIQLTLVYIPTAYGTVTPTLASATGVTADKTRPRHSLTQAEIEAEKLDSQAANQARIERELVRMREEIEAMKEELAREREER
jgi:hypothetical protein